MKALILNGSPRPQELSSRRSAPPPTPCGRPEPTSNGSTLTGWNSVPARAVCSAARRTSVRCPRCGPCRRRTDPAGRSARGGDSDLLGRYVGPAEDALRTARSGFHGRIGSRPSAAPAKGKRALVIAACTTPWPFNILARQSRGAVRSIREILGTGGMKVRPAKSPAPGK